MGAIRVVADVEEMQAAAADQRAHDGRVENDDQRAEAPPLALLEPGRLGRLGRRPRVAAADLVTAADPVATAPGAAVLTQAAAGPRVGRPPR